MPVSRRLPALDGVRALGVLSVIAYHVARACGYAEHGAFAGAVSDLKAGVCLFFVVSGLSLYLPWARALRDGAPAPTLRPYTQRRAARILPAYWLALAATGILDPASGAFGADGWRYWSLGQIYDPGTTFGGVGVAWTLCVEVTFYLALPLLAGGLRRVVRWSSRGAAVGDRHGAALQLACLGCLAAASLLVRLAVCGSWSRAVPASAARAMVGLPGTLDLFCLGMALAVLAAAWESGTPLLRPLAALARRGGLCLLAAAALYSLAAVLDSRDLFAPLFSPATELLLAACATLVCLPALPSAHGRPSRAVAALAHPVPVWIGTVSYGAYLWHLTVLELLQRGRVLAAVPPGALRTAAVLASVTLGGLACGAVSWYLVERPCLRRVRRVRRVRPARALARPLVRSISPRLRRSSV